MVEESRSNVSSPSSGNIDDTLKAVTGRGGSFFGVPGTLMYLRFGCTNFSVNISLNLACKNGDSFND